MKLDSPFNADNTQDDDYRAVSQFYDFFLEPFIHPIRRAVVEAILHLQAKTVLDLCCGTGKQLSMLPETIDAVGVDLSPAMLAVAQNNGNVNCRKEDATQTSFPSHSFDVVMSQFALHEKDPITIQKKLSEVNRVLKPQGRFIVVDFSLPVFNRRFSKIFNWGIRQIERLAGEDHFCHYKAWMENGGLFGILKEHGWNCQSKKMYYGDNIGLAVFKSNLSLGIRLP